MFKYTSIIKTNEVMLAEVQILVPQVHTVRTNEGVLVFYSNDALSASAIALLAGYDAFKMFEVQGTFQELSPPGPAPAPDPVPDSVPPPWPT